MTQGRASSRDEKRRAVRRTKFRRTSKPRDPLNRLVLVLVVFCLIGVGFVAVLVDLQVVRPERYRDWGESQRTGVRQLAAYRGQIVDRNGFVLASSTPSQQVIADPAKILDPATTATLLAPVLGIDAAELTKRLTPGSKNDRYELLGRALPDTTANAIIDLKGQSNTTDHMAAIFVEPEEDRIYPGGNLARGIVGRVDPDEIGYSGVEDQYNEAMTGIPGSEVFERGAFGSISVGDWSVNPASAGYDVVLTLDYRIQYVAEQALLEHCVETGANGASAVISAPKTGEILAMVSVARAEDGTCIIPAYNKALVDTFEPGSVLKPIAVTAAVEELGYTSETMIDVPSSVVVGGATFRDHPAHAGAPYPISQIMSSSMNVGTIRISQQVGPGYVHDYQRRFGLGQLTGLGAKGEEAGLVRPADEWQGSDFASIAIGQGITVTAAQLAGAYNVLANDGVYQNLSLVRSLRAPDGTEFPRNQTPTKAAISPATATEMTNILTGVVESGTGRSASIEGYKVAGKTGTAWKVFTDADGKTGYGESGNRRYVATFAGYVPANDPALSMVIVVDEPQGAFYASAVAAPIFSKVGLYALRILGIPSDGTATVPEGRVRAEPALWPGALDGENGAASELAENAAPGNADSEESPEDEAADPATDDGTTEGGEDGAEDAAGENPEEPEEDPGLAGTEVSSSGRPAEGESGP